MRKSLQILLASFVFITASAQAQEAVKETTPATEQVEKVKQKLKVNVDGSGIPVNAGDIKTEEVVEEVKDNPVTAPAVSEDMQEEQAKAEKKIEEVKEEVKAEEVSEDAKAAEEKSTETKVEEVEKAAEEKIEQVKSESEKPKVSVASFVNAEGEVAVEGVSLSKDLLAEIYSPRDYKTIFFNGKTPNDNYEKALQFISKADENGLSRRYFDANIIRKRLAGKEQNEAMIAKTDVLITHMVVEMIQLIGNGHIIPKELDLQTYFKRPVRVTSPAAAFEEFLKDKDYNSLIEKYSPKHPQYSLLKKELATTIKKYDDKRDLPPLVYAGDVYVGQKNNVVSEVRERIGSGRIINPSVDEDAYDKKLELAVKSFQKKHGLKETGAINKELIDTINNSDEEHISRLKANMERYRWLPDDLEPTRIEVNMAEFKLYAYQDGELKIESKAIVGRAEKKTPIMNTRMFQFVMNPYWYVPKAYAIRSMISLLRHDPNYAKNQNFTIMKLEKEGWKKMSQSEVNWDSVTADNYNFLLRQEPGNINVLGPIKMALVNPYDIYLHSTTEPWLFTNDFRGYSSGCLRIEHAQDLGKFVIDNGGADLSHEKYDELYKAYYSPEGRIIPNKPEMSDKYFKLKNPIPTYTQYFTIKIDDKGNVTTFDDFYKLDYEQAKLLGL